MKLIYFVAMVGGRPRADFDQHKDLIIKLYREKTPWSKIEEVLLNEHGCRVKSRTIMRRFKEWDLDFHRVITTKSDDLDHHIKSYWEDKTTRPKTDEELRQRLHDDGFTVSLSAIIQIRKKLNLYRRWDERLGRHRPDSELGKRGRHRQKHSAFTEAKLVPSPDASDSEDAQQPVQEPGQSSRPYPGPSPAPMRQPNQSIQLAPQPDPAINRDVDPDITSRDA